MSNVLAQASFIGEYAHNIDKKGRIIIPARFRDELSGKIVVAKGLDGCLNIYTQQQWAILMEQLASLPNTKREARVYRRNILAKASECEIDSQGRILIPSVLIQEAKIEKECVIAGVGSLIEIWSKSRWDAFMDEHSDDFEEVAEGLTEFLQ